MANELESRARRLVSLYWAATIPAWAVAVAWLMGWVGRTSLAGPERGRQCDGTLLPAGTDFSVAMVWAVPVVFGIATAAVLLLLVIACGEVRGGHKRWYSPNLLTPVFVLPVLAWMQLMATQRVVGELVALFPHSQLCGG